MAPKESDDYSIDYEFIRKYIKDDSNCDKADLKKEDKRPLSWKDFESEKQGTIEVFNNVGEGESYPENTNFNKKQDENNEGFETFNGKVECIPKPNSEARQEFLKHLEDDSLSIDTCNRLNHDWKRK